MMFGRWVIHFLVLKVRQIDYGELRLDQGKIGLVSGDKTIDELPFSLYQVIMDKLPSTTIFDAKELLLEHRLIKSASEIDKIKKSAQIADRAINAAKEALKIGSCEFDIVSSVRGQLEQQVPRRYLVAISSQAMQDAIGPPKKIH